MADCRFLSLKDNPVVAEVNGLCERVGPIHYRHEEGTHCVVCGAMGGAWTDVSDWWARSENSCKA